ncbi:hypothetical protein AVEN_179158-1 [Araneus ventricosus]|uniref:Uncharacterized protein n=1 Tax=Araneus ventricosus TaxID=182803 RepID=A0A4Y2HN62_ARAVE|nr:hypothetical protein AVEN_179158-1 [Araneus ventricosus]
MTHALSAEEDRETMTHALSAEEDRETMTHALSAEEDREVAERHARVQSSANQYGRKMCALNVVTNGIGLRVERRHPLQGVCLQDFVLVEQIEENRLGLSLVGQRFSSEDDADDEMLTTFNTRSYCG